MEHQNDDTQTYDPKIFNFVDTTATQKIFELSKRIRAVSGGTSSSKTVSILVWLMDYCQQTHARTKLASVCSESHPHLEKGAILDFQNIMKDRGYWREERWNQTKHTYTFETGNKLEFYSVDSYGKAHGPRRDVLFLNECNNMAWNIVDQLITRTREIIWMDWNPSEDFWFYTNILGKRDDVDFMGDGGNYPPLTFLDNEALDSISLSEINSHRWDEEWWRVYGQGLRGRTKARIYEPWEQIDEIPEEARLKVKGLDFGYANDPTALVDIYEYNGGYILDEQLYEKGLLNNQIAKTIGKDTVITIADSSEPKSIAEIAQHGISIIGSKKGKGSISHGIDKVKTKKIWVTKRSLNIIKENRNYIFIVDKEGNITNEPRDLFNHTMDAIRYGIAFIMPDIEEEEDNDSIESTKDYETPGIGKILHTTSMPVSTIQTINPQGTHRERLAALANRKKDTESTDYETDTPWQPPGINV